MAEALNAEVAEISGTVERITYKNQNNGYTVAEVKLPGESITVVGMLPFLTEGDCAVFYGSYTVHPTYGRQFKAESFERKTPENAAAVLRYLSSGAIKGVGPATAQRIVEKFGTQTFDVLENDPARLATIKGISSAKAREICTSFKAQFSAREMLTGLTNLGLSQSEAIKTYNLLKDVSFLNIF